MKRWLIALVLCLGVSTAYAAPLAKLHDVPPGYWAAGAVHRVVKAGLMKPDSTGKFNGSRVVTRYELAVVLDRLVHDMNAAHKPLSALPPHAVSLPKGIPAPVAAALKRLVRGGYLPANSPLVTEAGNKPVTADELASALSEVTIRLSSAGLPPYKS